VDKISYTTARSKGMPVIDPLCPTKGFLKVKHNVLQQGKCSRQTAYLKEKKSAFYQM
jgi:hypothetical protein